MKKCKECGEWYTPLSNKSIFCTARCYHIKYRKDNRIKLNEYNRKWMLEKRHRMAPVRKKKRKIVLKKREGYCKECGIRLTEYNIDNCKLKGCPHFTKNLKNV